MVLGCELERASRWSLCRLGTCASCAVVVLAALFAYRSRSDVAAAARTMRDADPRFVVAAIAVQLAVIALIALSYRPALRHMGHDLRFVRLLSVQLRRQVVSMVAPLGCAGSAYAFVRGLGRYRVGVDDALVAMAVRSVASSVAYSGPLLLFFALDRPSGVLLLAAAVLVGYHVVKAALVLTLLGQRGTPRRRRWIPQRVGCFIQHARRYEFAPRDLASPALIALAGHFANVVALAAWLHAVGQPTSLVVPLTALVAGVVATFAAPFFHGLGVVELSMAAALHGSGVPLEAAIGATLLYRVCDFGLPLLLCGIGLLVERLGAQWSLPGAPVVRLERLAQRGRTLPSTLLPSEARRGLSTVVASVAGLAVAVPLLLALHVQSDLLSVIRGVMGGIG